MTHTDTQIATSTSPRMSFRSLKNKLGYPKYFPSKQNCGSPSSTFQKNSKVSIKLPTSGSFNSAKFLSFKLQTSAVLIATQIPSYCQTQPAQSNFNSVGWAEYVSISTLNSDPPTPKKSTEKPFPLHLLAKLQTWVCRAILD